MTSAESKTIQFCLLTLTTIAVAFALTYTKFMLVPFVFSIFTFATLSPIIKWMQSVLKLPRLVAITATLLLIGLFSTLFILAVLPTLKQILYGLNNYDSYLANLITALEARVPHLQMDQDRIYAEIKKLNPVLYLRNVTEHAVVLIGNISLVLIYTSFLLAGESSARKRSPLMSTIFQKISEYAVKKTFLSLACGLVFLSTLGGFGMELTLVFAMAAVLLNFIPTVGPITAVLLPFPVVFYNFGFEWQFFFIFSVLGSMQFLIGNILEPYVLGEIMDLHPITVLICLVFWGLIWGVAGMFLAVPITAVLKIVFDRIDATRAFAELLAGRFPNPEDPK